MNRREAKIPQKKYIVTITKSFEYPSCVVDHRNKLTDVFQKASSDFLDVIARGVNLNEFELNLESELPFKIKTSKDLKDSYLNKKLTTSSMEYYIKEIVITDVEAKYGSLNREINPSIYTYEERAVWKERPLTLRNENGNPIDEDDEEYDEDYEEDEPPEMEKSYYLKDEVANYYDQRYNYYNTIIKRKAYV